MNAATTPKLRNTMAAVSCRESGEKNDTDVSQLDRSTQPQDPSVQVLMTIYFSVRYEADWVLF